ITTSRSRISPVWSAKTLPLRMIKSGAAVPPATARRCINSRTLGARSAPLASLVLLSVIASFVSVSSLHRGAAHLQTKITASASLVFGHERSNPEDDAARAAGDGWHPL